MHGDGGDAVLLVIKNRHRDTGNAEHNFFIVYSVIVFIVLFLFNIQLINVGERVRG